MIRALVLAATLGVAIARTAGTADAETRIEIPRSTVQVTLDDRWTAIHAPEVVAAFRHEGGLVLAITRADVPNPDAWIERKKQAYADQVERGIKDRIPGYKRLTRKLATANGVPALDLEARREGGATVVVRVLLFRTYALSLAIEVPKGANRAIARALVKTFAPPKPQPAPVK